MAENKKTYHYDLRGRNGQMYLVLDKYLGLLIRSDKYRNIAQSSAIAGSCIFLTAILFRDRGNSGRLPPIETAMLLFLSPVLIVICIKQLIYVIVALDMPDYDGKTRGTQDVAERELYCSHFKRCRREGEAGERGKDPGQDAEQEKSDEHQIKDQDDRAAFSLRKRADQELINAPGCKKDEDPDDCGQDPASEFPLERLNEA